MLTKPWLNPWKTYQNVHFTIFPALRACNFVKKNVYRRRYFSKVLTTIFRGSVFLKVDLTYTIIIECCSVVGKLFLMKLPVNHERYFNEQWTKVCCIETNLRDCYEQTRLNYSNAVHVYRDDINNLDLRKFDINLLGKKTFINIQTVFICWPFKHALIFKKEFRLQF